MARGAGRHTSERGTALVEFALLLPFLTILVFGTVDVGRGYAQWNKVKNAAREGANYAQYFPSAQAPAAGGSCGDPDNIAYRARAETGNGTDTTYQVLVNGVAASGCSTAATKGTDVTVTVTRPLQLYTPFLAKFLGTVTTRASVTVNVQGSGTP